MPKHVINTLIKAPESILDYSFDWQDWLRGDQVTSTSWTVPSPLENMGVTFKPWGLSTVFIGGGTLGAIYTIICGVTTEYGRSDQRSLKLRIVER